LGEKKRAMGLCPVIKSGTHRWEGEALSRVKKGGLGRKLLKEVKKKGGRFQNEKKTLGGTFPPEKKDQSVRTAQKSDEKKSSL